MSKTPDDFDSHLDNYGDPGVLFGDNDDWDYDNYDQDYEYEDAGEYDPDLYDAREYNDDGQG